MGCRGRPRALSLVKIQRPKPPVWHGVALKVSRLFRGASAHFLTLNAARLPGAWGHRMEDVPGCCDPQIMPWQLPLMAPGQRMGDCGLDSSAIPGTAKQAASRRMLKAEVASSILSRESYSCFGS
jgi:hypothetical protein